MRDDGLIQGSPTGSLVRELPVAKSTQKVNLLKMSMKSNSKPFWLHFVHLVQNNSPINVLLSDVNV